MISLINRLIRFFSVGVLNTVVGLSTIWALMLAGMSPLSANVCGYFLGLLISFFINRSWTFRDRAHFSFVRFSIAFVISYACNIMVLHLGLTFTSISPYLLQAMSIVIYTVIFFSMCHIFVFWGSDSFDTHHRHTR